MKAIRRAAGSGRLRCPLSFIAAGAVAGLALALFAVRHPRLREEVLARQPLEALLRQADERPHDLHLQLHVARRLLQAERLSEALRMAERAVRAAPQDPESWLVLGRAALRADRLQVAATAGEQALAVAGRGLFGDARGQAEAHLLLGEVYSRSQSSHGAIAQFRRYTELRPRDPRGWCALGQEFLRIDSLRYARSAAERALAVRRGDPEALVLMGEAHRREGALSDAERYFRKALAAAPASSDALLGLGRVLLVQSHDPGKLAAAVRVLQAAARAAPRRADVRIELANALAEQGRLRDAVAEWKEALALDPSEPAALHALAQALTRLGRCEEAAAWRRAFEEQVRYRLELDAVVARLRQAPDSASVHFALARVHLRFRQPERAATALRAGLALDPSDAWARRTLARLEAHR